MDANLSLYDPLEPRILWVASQSNLNASQWSSEVTRSIMHSVVEYMRLGKCTCHSGTGQRVHHTSAGEDSKVSQLTGAQTILIAGIDAVGNEQQPELVKGQFSCWSDIGKSAKEIRCGHVTRIQTPCLEPAANFRENTRMWPHELLVVIGHGTG